MKKNDVKVLLIIAAYNEEENILNTYNTIVNYNKKNKANYDVIVIMMDQKIKQKKYYKKTKLIILN